MKGDQFIIVSIVSLAVALLIFMVINEAHELRLNINHKPTYDCLSYQKGQRSNEKTGQNLQSFCVDSRFATSVYYEE